MPAYVEELLEKVNMSGVNGKNTPFPPALVLRKEDMPVTPEDVSAMACEPYCSYRSLVGALLYLAGLCGMEVYRIRLWCLNLIVIT